MYSIVVVMVWVSVRPSIILAVLFISTCVVFAFQKANDVGLKQNQRVCLPSCRSAVAGAGALLHGSRRDRRDGRDRGFGEISRSSTTSLSSSVKPVPEKQLKSDLLRAISESRKRDIDMVGSKLQILKCVVALEEAARSSQPIESIDGKWSLIYSTSSRSIGKDVSSRDEDEISAFDILSNELYKIFFKFAPALAGNSETENVSNTQQIDLASNTISNRVVINPPNALLPLPKFVIEVYGECRAIDSENEVEIVFTRSKIGLLQFPLPRPKGTLKTTYCDDTLRISRGGSGGVFIVNRV